MKDYLVLFAKSLGAVFLIMCVGFLLLQYDLTTLLFKAMEGALLLSVALLLLQLLFTKVTTGSFAFQSRYQEQQIVVENTTFEVLCAKINDQLHWKVVHKKPDRVVYKSSFRGFLTFGEYIEVTLMQRSESRLQIRVKSTPQVPFILYDFAKGYKNIAMIQQLIA